MKIKGFVELTEAQIRNFFSTLSRADCEFLLQVLARHLEQTNYEKQLLPGKHLMLSESFLETPVEQLGLKPRTIKQLKKYNISKVRNITEIGLDRLRLFNRIGEGTVKEIEEALFHEKAQ